MAVVMMRTSLALIAAVFLATACENNQEYYLLEEDAPALPELSCPVPVPEATDPGPLPVADPARVGTEPDIGGCGVRPRSMSRLNRAEYDRTVQAVFGIDIAPARYFPVDDTLGGFDNNADVLAVGALLFEKYFEAAAQVADAALDDGAVKPQSHLIEAEAAWGAPNEVPVHVLESEGKRIVVWTVAEPGEYEFAVRAYGEQAGAVPPMMEVLIDDAYGDVFDVDGTASQPVRVEIRRWLEAGEHTFSVAYLNDYYRAENLPRGIPEVDRNLAIDYLEITGPFGAAPAAEVPAPRAALLTCNPDEDSSVSDEDCGAEILSRVGRLLLRRPVETAEVAQWTSFIRLARSNGDSFEHGLRLALRALLLHPGFLFRVEVDDQPDVPRAHLVDDFELASRLSYFLWSAGPDDRLLTLAEQGALTDPAVLEAEALRMLDDERARSITDNFAGQWLQTRAVDAVQVDYGRFPQFSDNLKQSMKCETELVFNEVFREGGSVRDLVTADFTYVNPLLDRHYDFDLGVAQAEEGAGHKYGHFERVDTSATERRGVLTHAGTLTLGAHPDRTSPVRRGKWVLDQLLCIPPPPPPPMVEGLPEQEEGNAKTFRELMIQHRTDPNCMGCHTMMDPIGLGLENFDAIGRWRTEDENGLPVEPSDSLFGQEFSGHGELIEMLADHPNLQRCMVKKTMSYALSRTVSYQDECAVQDTVERAALRGGSIRDVFVEVVLSPQFRMRRPMQQSEWTDLYGLPDDAPGGAE